MFQSSYDGQLLRKFFHYVFDMGVKREFSIKMNPQYFALSSFTKFTPINRTLDVWLKCRICVYGLLRAILYELIHNGTFISSLSRHEVNDFFLEYIKFASSAKRYVVTFGQHLGKSFM